jgi:hypothetical protein
MTTTSSGGDLNGRYTLPGLDTTVPNPARRYDYLLGGKDNFAIDRESAHQLLRQFPHLRTAAVENRRFLIRAVRHLAHAGIHQFLDIGTGFPTKPNLHDAVQDIDPANRVLYVDHDPLVVVHARALLTSTRPGAVGYLQADLRDPVSILDSRETRTLIDLSKPVGLLLVAVLHFLQDSDHPCDAVATLLDALPRGSHIVLSHATFDPLPDGSIRDLTALAKPAAGHGPFRPRTHDEIVAFLTGLDLIDPGLVSIVDWRPDEDPKSEATAAEAICYGAIAKLT